MPSSAFNLFIVLLLIIANAIFVMSEMAIVSARKVRLQQNAQQGDRRARAALKLANNPNNFLAAVQVGITMIAIVSGAFGEKTLSEILQPLLNSIPGLTNYSQAIAFVLSIITITYLTLIVGELVPKRLALNSPESIAGTIAGPMSVIAKIAAPIVYLLSNSTDIVIRLLGIRPSDEPQVTEEEIRVMIEQGTEAGMFEQAEEDIMKRVFQLGDRRVSSIMTPRPEIIWLDLDDSDDENRQTLREQSHARYPICRDGLDTILGITQVYDLLRDSMDEQPLDFTSKMLPPLFVPESTRALKVLDQFKQTGNQMAFVVDEYGVIQGLVTLTDILQALVGDLPSAEELAEPQAIKREDGSWLFDGMLPIYEFKALLDIEDEELPGEQRGSFQTLGGFVVMHLGKIPISTDHFTWNDYRFEVMDMDGNRVDKVLVGPAEIL
ncbi:HlyC/CorC family transporter [filamentous cyanobacterium LEGE 11480]|uniref:HlyC/CorC family transporter n=1 Tax=Romeriopsis navalis LEGE 11480 TaxID=2777977 RepID=A0A928VQR3_9CYAN|nr:hemolysin family protein [Romeriopsis navalis]MBE9030865.1 HlyC/CorC family transporter [Romeriopsis navalis LEGE 11480]